jgi:D-serine deaminase-like pyridoxal phosphate-dependent protein
MSSRRVSMLSQARFRISELAPAAGAIQETRDRVKRAYASAVGQSRHDLLTPALILDLPAARRNINKMADRLKTMPAKLRPHIKVHKSPELARIQIDAGAIGISTATVWEAVVMVRSGLDSIFIVNTLAGREKLAALAEIARDADVMVAVDDAQNAADIAAAARAANSTVGVMIEVDTGMDRAGVDSAEQAVALAGKLAGLKGIRLLGVTGYEGHCSLTPDRDLRSAKQRTAMGLLGEVAEEIRAAGFPIPIVSAGGTATWDWTAQTPGVTEIQAGSYAVMDNFHAPMAADFEHALTVLATVISRPPERVIVDAGNKSLGAAALSTIRGHDLAGMRFDEEHGIFVATPEYPLHVGDVVELVPGYAPGTVNWYDAYHVVEGDRVVDIWPVIPRGPGHGGLIS